MDEYIKEKLETEVKNIFSNIPNQHKTLITIPTYYNKISHLLQSLGVTQVLVINGPYKAPHNNILVYIVPNEYEAVALLRKWVFLHLEHKHYFIFTPDRSDKIERRIEYILWRIFMPDNADLYKSALSGIKILHYLSINIEADNIFTSNNINLFKPLYDTIIIMDRTQDMITPLLHPKTYAGCLVKFSLKIIEGKVYELIKFLDPYDALQVLKSLIGKIEANRSKLKTNLQVKELRQYTEEIFVYPQRDLIHHMETVIKILEITKKNAEYINVEDIILNGGNVKKVIEYLEEATKANIILPILSLAYQKGYSLNYNKYLSKLEFKYSETVNKMEAIGLLPTNKTIIEVERVLKRKVETVEMLIKPAKNTLFVMIGSITYEEINIILERNSSAHILAIRIDYFNPDTYFKRNIL